MPLSGAGQKNKNYSSFRRIIEHDADLGRQPSQGRAHAFTAKPRGGRKHNYQAKQRN
jgi:hypothetical protein